MESNMRAPQLSEALAYDRQQRNRRAIFALQHRVLWASTGIHLQRQWLGVAAQTVATEAVHWQDGLRQVDAEQVSLSETTQAHIDGQRALTLLSSPRTDMKPRERALVLPHAPVTLAAMPLFIAQHWQALQAGDRLRASYLVLKVQRAATVTVQRVPAPQGQTHISVSPTNPLLRAIFGSTRYEFEDQRPALLAVDGLLDPRDLRPSGRWREYLGRIEFSAAVGLPLLAAQHEAQA
jgi:hypothetical protein